MTASHFALLIAAPPKEPTRGVVPMRAFSYFLERIDALATPATGTEMLSINVLWIPLNTGMPVINALFSEAEQHGIVLRILFLDEKPTWIEYPMPPAQAGIPA